MQAQLTHQNFIQQNKKDRIRPLALCIFRRNNQILVKEGYDNAKEVPFFTPPGGGLAFGEYSWETIRRQIKNELGEDIKNLSFLGPTEYVKQDGKSIRHEIIFVFEGEFENHETYHREEISGTDVDGKPVKAHWKPLSDFKKKKERLYPDVLLELISG